MAAEKGVFLPSHRSGMIRSMGQRERDVLRHMAAHDGVITRSEALALGMSPSTITRRVRDGHFIQVAKGLYAQPGIYSTELVLLRAATSALNATASHESAARLHGLSGLDPRRVAVTVPIRRSNRFRGVLVHQLTDLMPNETTSVKGLPTTKISRTLIDLASVLPPRKLMAVLDEAVRRKLTAYEHVSDHLERVARSGKPGVTRLRGILEPRLAGPFVSDSNLETQLLDLIEKGGLPTPSTQFKPRWLRYMNGRVDLAYPHARLVIEGDSLRWHGSPKAFQADRRRDNLAQLAGWRMLRFTWEDITERPEYVIGTIRKALEDS